MAGRYRALLIGNSTYPSDEHNLQTLRGPVKDIAALNRALVDEQTGMFADVEVTLLPEATSGRAIRALGRFFGAAERGDVLLLFFSGHGKLDQNGRLHLCMQDTDSADLLATAVSSARINEFADASRARNVVIVLDCCHAGAFRGGDVPDTVAGPGRYVLTRRRRGGWTIRPPHRGGCASRTTRSARMSRARSRLPMSGPARRFRCRTTSGARVRSRYPAPDRSGGRRTCRPAG
ncbi:caspase family protein [Actinoplanes sp. NPDC051470]|uniref:caspase family protein n=1 Tax=unclassified Actinoplanes TaxID=2626549 RepID=UPI00343B0080